MEHGSARIGEVFNFGMLHLEWPTALFILIVFLVTMTVLNILLFKPIIRSLEARKAIQDKNEQEAQSLSSSMEKSEAAYKEKLTEIREKINQTRQQALDESLASAKELIDKTKETIKGKIEIAEKELSGDLEKAFKDAELLTSDLSELIKTKVLA